MAISITLIIYIAIALCFMPVLMYLSYKLWKFAEQKWREHKNEVDMRYYAPRFEERRQAEIPDAAASAARGRYDMAVEELLARRSFSEARALCAQQLSAEDISEQQREMYERYIRVIDELS